MTHIDSLGDYLSRLLVAQMKSKKIKKVDLAANLSVADPEIFWSTGVADLFITNVKTGQIRTYLGLNRSARKETRNKGLRRLAVLMRHIELNESGEAAKRIKKHFPELPL